MAQGVDGGGSVSEGAGVRDCFRTVNCRFAMVSIGEQVVRVTTVMELPLPDWDEYVYCRLKLGQGRISTTAADRHCGLYPVYPPVLVVWMAFSCRSCGDAPARWSLMVARAPGAPGRERKSIKSIEVGGSQPGWPDLLPGLRGRTTLPMTPALT